MAILKNTTIPGSSGQVLPKGTTSQRPSNADTGMLRYNTDDRKVEMYDGIDWFPIAGQVVEPGIHFYRISQSTELPEYWKCSTPYDIRTASFQGSGMTAGDCLSTSPDGRVVYVINRDSGFVEQRLLNVPFDITQGYTAFGTKSVYTNDRFATPIFSRNGEYFFVNQGDSGDDVARYSMSTPWDVTTASQDQRISVPPNMGSGIGRVSFNPDGTRMYAGQRAGSPNENIYQFDLSTPYDLDSLSNAGSFTTSGFTDPLAVQLSGDGAFLYIHHHSPNDSTQWKLTRPYDITSAIDKYTLDDGLNIDSIYMHGEPQHIVQMSF